MIKKFNWKETKKSVFFEKKKKNITLIAKKNIEFLKHNSNQLNKKSRVCIHKNVCANQLLKSQIQYRT